MRRGPRVRGAFLYHKSQAFCNKTKQSFSGEDNGIKFSLFACVALLATVMLPAGANAQDTIKIGVIMPYSGQFADPAPQMDNGLKLYMKQHGDTVAGKKIEIIRKDTGGVGPDVAKRLAQELIVRDKVDILAGFALTPKRSRAADVSTEAKKFMVIMNAATSIITTTRPTCARVSLTLPSHETLGTWAAKNAASRKPTPWFPIMARASTRKRIPQGIQGSGGEIVGSVRLPVANPDFSAFVQRAKDPNPEAIFVFVPGGTQPAAIGKALAERGIDPKKTKILRHRRTTRRQRAQEHGRHRARHHHRLALRSQPQVQDQRGFRQGI